MATLSLFPARIRFTNADGTLTPEAYRALQVLFQRVGGTLGDNGEDVFAAFGGGDMDATMGEVSARETLMQSASSDDCCQSPDLLQSVAQDRAFPDVSQSVEQKLFFSDVVQPATETAFDLAAAINGATSKTTPVDADVMPIADSASDFSLKKITWANLKATLATWINSNLIPASFTALNTSGNASIGNGSQPTLSIGGQSGNYNTLVNLIASNVQTNWQLKTAAVSNDLSIIPSTTPGGSTFTTPVVTFKQSGLEITGTISSSGTISPQKATTAGAPAFVKGAVYFDLTLNKLRVGGATAWETITSV